MRDMYSNILERGCIPPALYTVSALGAAVDVRKAVGVTFIAATGVAGGVFAGVLQESVNGTTWTDVAAGQFQTDAPAALAAASVYRWGYLGTQAYARLNVAKTSGTDIYVSVVAILDPETKPAA